MSPNLQTPTIEVDPDVGVLDVKVVLATGEEVFFKTKRTTKLSKLLVMFANKLGKDVHAFGFSHYGTRILDDDTPASLGMEDYGIIDAVVWQTSG